MSTAEQVAGTLRHFFPTTSGVDVVYLLKVRTGMASKGSLKWESPDAKVCGSRPDEGLFPHLYFESRLYLNSAEVEDVKSVASKAGEDGWDVGLLDLGDWLI